jgi:hypothetical protein
MSAANVRKQLIVAAVALIAIFTLSSAAASLKTQTGDVSKLLGDWEGESICTGNNPACHDEHVVYHISKSPDGPDKVILAADKIIDGKPDPMYVLDFKYDAEKGTLTGEFSNSRYHGVWEYAVKGNTMEGTLTLLPGKTIGRRIKVTKVK